MGAVERRTASFSHSRRALYVDLTGHVDGVELAHFTHQHYPNIHVIVTSGRALTKDLPDGPTFMPKPWMAFDLLREAERSQH
jgi:hypothetical protein